MSNKNAGFTLIEVILVTAVSGLLLIIAFVGQHQLQAKARFDAGIDKIMQHIDYTRSYALSNVDESGNGNNPNIEYAGAAIEFEHQNLGLYQLTEIEPIYAAPDPSGNPDPATLGNWPYGLPNPSPECPAANHPEGNWECYEKFVGLPDDIDITGANDAEIYFIKTGHGLQVCHDVNAGSNTIPQACTINGQNSFTIQFKDSEGFTAKISVDGVTGYVHRQ